MTLVEVLLATVILGAGLVVLMTCASRCLAIMRASKEYQNAQWVLAVGQLEYPMSPTNNVKLFEVEPITYQDRYTFSRAVGDDEDDDSLYVVQTRVEWSVRGQKTREEIVQYILQTEDEE
jgi:Tfp pilus assembly protein PilV